MKTKTRKTRMDDAEKKNETREDLKMWLATAESGAVPRLLVMLAQFVKMVPWEAKTPEKRTH